MLTGDSSAARPTMIHARRLVLPGLLIAVCGCAPQPVSPGNSQKASPTPAAVKADPEHPEQPVAKAEAPVAPAKSDVEVAVAAKAEPKAATSKQTPAEPFRFAET